MVHAGGRPRTSCPEKEELIELGEDLVRWALEKKEGELRARYCEWYTAKGFIMKQWDHFRDKPEFWWYYERARSLLGTKYLDGTVNPTIGQRVIWKYVTESKAQDIERMTKEAEVKAKALMNESKALSYRDDYQDKGTMDKN